MTPTFYNEQHRAENFAYVDQMIQSLTNGRHPAGAVAPMYADFFGAMLNPNRPPAVEAMRSELAEHVERNMNARASMFRSNTRGWQQFPTYDDVMKSGLAKAALDVGTLTNFANIVGGQSVGYVSLDTQMARGTVRPDSFTLYQSLRKSAAFQPVDYWAYNDDTGGGAVGTSFTGFGNVSSGTLTNTAGIYQLNNITLRLGLNGRAVTTALAAQNNFVDVAATENANAALTVLASFDWCSFNGNPTLYPNQFTGIYNVLSGSAEASGNIYNFQTWSAQSQVTAQGWSTAEQLFNLIYEAAAQITKYGLYGRITHAFMAPNTAATLQGLITSQINNWANLASTNMTQGIVVNGDLQGMKTRFGMIQFPIDLYIPARDVPVQAVVNSLGNSNATSAAPTPVAAVGVTVTTGAVAGSNFTSAWAGTYVWAVGANDSYMNESTLVYSTTATVASGNSVTLSITGATAADGAAFRVYRSGLGYNLTGAGNNPASFRFIGEVAASGAAAVAFTDLNSYIPGSEKIFLLDMDDRDGAIDFRFLLPLTRIDLFAQNLYMPWAVAMIGATRVKIPKFHGVITQFVPENPQFNPLAANLTASYG